MHATSSDCGSHVPARVEKNERTRKRGTAVRHPDSSRVRRLTIFAVLSIVTLASLVVGRGDTPAAEAAPTPRRLCACAGRDHRQWREHGRFRINCRAAG